MKSSLLFITALISLEVDKGNDQKFCAIKKLASLGWSWINFLAHACVLLELTIWKKMHNRGPSVWAEPSMIGIFSTLLDRTNCAKWPCWTVLTQSLDYVESDSKRSVNLSKPFEHIQNTPAMGLSHWRKRQHHTYTIFILFQRLWCQAFFQTLIFIRILCKTALVTLLVIV